MRPPQFYAGVGSRETPLSVVHLMEGLGAELAPDWTLRSGYAEGADKAFARGAVLGGGDMENYLPWPGFNGAPRDDPRFISPPISKEMMELARLLHPAWDLCSPAARKLHARNGCQILGLHLDLPVRMVICWTVGGAGGGGTGQAIRIASQRGIPVFDLGRRGALAALRQFLKPQLSIF